MDEKYMCDTNLKLGAAVFFALTWKNSLINRLSRDFKLSCKLGNVLGARWFGIFEIQRGLHLLLMLFPEGRH